LIHRHACEAISWSTVFGGRLLGMDELITQSLRGKANDAQERQLAEWRRASPEHERRYQDIARVWHLTHSLDPSVYLRQIPDQVTQPEPNASELEEWRSRTGRTRRSLPTRWIPWAIAAVSLLALGTALWRRESVPAAVRNLPELRPAVFAAGVGEKRSIPLEDGTVVRLAPESRLQVFDVPGAREVWLEGRAFFAVAKQAGRPFKVRTRAGEAVVLGTQFDLEVKDQHLELVVVEGRVALTGGTPLTGGTKRVEVGPAERSVVIDGRGPSPAVRLADVRAAVRWVGEFLVFDSVPLGTAVQEIARVYGVRVELVTGAPTNRLVTGWFSDQNVNEVVSAVCLVVKTACSVQDSVITIGR